MIKQKQFFLTRDMVPIYFSDSKFSGITFICPLPKGYKDRDGRISSSISKNLEGIRPEANRIVEQINAKARTKTPPFENILLEYHEKTWDEQERLLRNFQITSVGIDNRGVYSVQAGGDVNSGDIYLSSDAHDWHDFRTAGALKELFEPRVAFYCHNVDFYWQALLDREFCVEYFNLLNRLIFEK